MALEEAVPQRRATEAAREGPRGPSCCRRDRRRHVVASEGRRSLVVPRQAQPQWGQPLKVETLELPPEPGDGRRHNDRAAHQDGGVIRELLQMSSGRTRLLNTKRRWSDRCRSRGCSAVHRRGRTCKKKVQVARRHPG